MVRQSGDNSEPGKLRAALFALLVHAAFLVLLIFGLNWKSETPEAIMVDLWTDLPQQQVRPSLPAEKIKSSSEPARVKPQLQPKKTEPQPRSVLKVIPPVRKPVIALKDKTEKPKSKEDVEKSGPVKKELPKRELARKPVGKPALKEDVRKPDPVKKEAPKAESIKEIEKKDDARQQAEVQEQAQRHEDEAAAEKVAQAGMNGEMEKYRAMIEAKIRSRIIMPPDLPGNPAVEFSVTLLPGGDVLAVALRKSSGYPAFDEAVERAIFLAKPLPLPSDPGLFSKFRNLDLIVYYHE